MRAPNGACCHGHRRQVHHQPSTNHGRDSEYGMGSHSVQPIPGTAQARGLAYTEYGMNSKWDQPIQGTKPVQPIPGTAQARGLAYTISTA
jgi:hypothetical protein